MSKLDKKPNRNRRSPRFSLRTGLILVAVSALVLSFYLFLFPRDPDVVFFRNKTGLNLSSSDLESVSRIEFDENSGRRFCFFEFANKKKFDRFKAQSRAWEKSPYPDDLRLALEKRFAWFQDEFVPPDNYVRDPDDFIYISSDRSLPHQVPWASGYLIILDTLESDVGFFYW